MGSSTEKYLPSRGLTIASAMAKGWGDYKKRLQEEEMQKQAQRSELLKIILPQYMKQQQSRAEWERERPLEQSKFALEQRKVEQTGQLGIAGLQIDIASLENAWNIANMQELSATERANAKNALDVQLKGIDAQIQGMIEQNKAGIAGAQITGRKEVAQIGAETDIGVASIGSGRALNVARINAASAEKIAGWNNDTKLVVAEMNKDTTNFPKALTLQANMYSAESDLATAVWGMALSNPDYTDLANMMTKQIAESKKALDKSLVTLGGAPMPDVPVPELTTKKTGFWPFRGEKTTLALPAADAQAPAQQLPSLQTTGVEFDKFVNMMLEQKKTTISAEQKQQLRQMGIDPDAIERAAQEAQK